ncbi:MAG: hypothetical protein CVV64_04310 [Candidatus Wallbacteria bacterium HGW-Wallbacteria-1]|jgi:hypothetical protein|uniref:Uncharacterized protein n=1 Tax=Candidatus Wallbacteria bacterium HGW-Wallbacteria-1 TaxID=2013854 RepID=A0A2N1PRN1_9BACT|nr:MAG: hypothetical protein CVV64_04310 [Candidatus Wallbacteria bacterium HGW-Wallbacteria-1]
MKARPSLTLEEFSKPEEIDGFCEVAEAVGVFVFKSTPHSDDSLILNEAIQVNWEPPALNEIK